MIIPHPALPLPDSKKSIFINCPYDSDYEPLFDAIIFTIVSCGFIPRSAKESGKVSVSRMERIFHAIYTSDYSIHDLSRCHGEGESLLARFNMPLELGLAMSRRYPGDGTVSHDWLVLVPEGAPYSRFVSDLAGYDLQPYTDGTSAVIRSVLAWLLNLPGAVPWQTPAPIIDRLQAFTERKDELKREWGDDIPWKTLLDVAKASVPDFA